MKKDSEILIIGAGPSGLSMGIFLYELGYRPRIIDKKSGISEYSKALAVNPRTLEIFDEFNLTRAFLQNGRKMPAVNFWKDEKIIFKNEFGKSKHKYPFLLIQPQKESEEILLEELANRNIPVEYSTQFESFTHNENEYQTVIVKEDKTIHTSNYIVGADGAHSMVRKQQNTEFEGFRYKETWELYDVELNMNLPEDEAHICMLEKGGMLMIRIKENVWRVAGNIAGLLNYLPKNITAGKVSWESKFTISHNLAKTLVKDNNVLIGDAAHLHSPIGGRGMNLGIEDAYIVSRLIKEDRLNEYDKLRKSYLRKTVKRIDKMTQLIAGYSVFSPLLRNYPGILKPFFPFIASPSRNFVLGLDKRKM